MFAGMIVLAAAVVGGEWTEGAVRFETGSDAVNRIVAEKPSGAYGSKVAEVYENLRHTGKGAEAKKEWQSRYDQVELAVSNRCDRAVTDEPFMGACWWLLETHMMLEIGPAVGGRWAYHPKYVPMNLKAEAFVRKNFLAGGVLPPPYRGQASASAFAAYLGLVEGDALAATCRDLVKALGATPAPSLDAFEWKVALDALSQNGMADAVYGLLMECGGAVDRGAAISWLWRNAAGIASDPTCAGFRNVIMAPKPDRRLGFVKAEYKSAAGVVKSAWRYEGGKWIWDFTVPRISTASVTLPGQNLTRHYDAGDHHVELDIGGR